MAHTPRLALLRNNDLLPGLSYPLPPQFYPLQIPAPHPGLSYATANIINTPLSPLHLLPALHHGRLYPVTSTQPHKTAETLNNKSRQNPELFRIKFLYSFFTYLLSLTLIIQISAHYYTPTSPHHYHHTLSAPPTTTLLYL
jgi:hypothetical protein